MKIEMEREIKRERERESKQHLWKAMCAKEPCHRVTPTPPLWFRFWKKGTEKLVVFIRNVPEQL